MDFVTGESFIIDYDLVLARSNGLNKKIKKTNYKVISFTICLQKTVNFTTFRNVA